MRAIFLCGFMGCGKTTVGRLAAKLCDCAFTDLDELIVSTEGMTIPEIFEKKGEPYFRSLESRLIGSFTEGIVATGGGALLSEENARIARSAGRVVYINTPFEICYERIKDDRNRPIAHSSTKEQLKERYDTRHPLYKAHSDLILYGGQTAAELAKRVSRLAND